MYLLYMCMCTHVYTRAYASTRNIYMQYVRVCVCHVDNNENLYYCILIAFFMKYFISYLLYNTHETETFLRTLYIYIYIYIIFFFYYILRIITICHNSNTVIQ